MARCLHDNVGQKLFGKAASDMYLDAIMVNHLRDTMT